MNFEFYQRESSSFPDQFSVPINFYRLNFESRPCDHNIPCESCASATPPVPDAEEEEAETHDELLQIVVECLEKVDTRRRKVLLEKFFAAIEQEASLECFLLERLKRSKVAAISSLFQNVSAAARLHGQENSGFLSSRELGDGCVGEQSKKKLERFKVKTINLGDAVTDGEKK